MDLFDILYLLFGILLGGGIGYGAFYMLYKDKKKVDQLKQDFEETKKILSELEIDNEGLSEENNLIRNEAQVLSDENDELEKIIKKLSIYINRIEKASDLVSELYQSLGVTPEELDEMKEKVELINKKTRISPMDTNTEENTNEDNSKLW